MESSSPNSRSRRIAHIAYTFLEDDARVRRYCEASAEIGYEVHVFCLRRKGQGKKDHLNGVTVFRLQKREINEKTPIVYLARILRFWLLVGIRISLNHLIRPYHLIHVHNVPDFLIFSCLICKCTGAKVILDIHDLLPELYVSKFAVSSSSMMAKFLMFVERLSARFADHVIVANEIWREKLIRRALPERKCTSLLNYPNTKIFRPRSSSEGERKQAGFTILYPGTLNSHQGLGVAIKALEILKDKIPGVRLEIYGEGPDLPKLMLMVKELGLEERVSFNRPVPLEQIASIMARANLGVIPKLADDFGNEAFSTKSLEFMACGVPVVMSRTMIDTFYFSDEHVRFFEPGNAEDLAEAIWEVYSRPEQTRRRVEAALQLISRDNWHTRKNEYLALITKLTERKKKNNL